MSYRSIAGSLLLLAAHSASASSWTFENHSVALGSDEGGDYALITLRGGSTNSCIPLEAVGSIHHATPGTPATADYTLVLPGPDEACFSAIRPWEYVVRLPDPVLGSTYAVELLAGDEPIGSFDVVVTAAAAAAAEKAAAIPGFAPTQGIWWSSANPGTGVAFNVDAEGRWFSALYLYDEAGNPTFLTMQGASLAYNLDNPAAAYAIGTSPLILSEGGQCLQCPWSKATASDTGDDADLIFHSATRATLKVGAWSLDLTPLPTIADEFYVYQAPKVGEHYSMMLDAPTSGRHVVVVEAIPGDGGVLTGQSRVALKCVDCRTVDAAGVASPAIDDALAQVVEEEIQFNCTAHRCTMTFHDTAGYPVVNKDASRIDVLVNRVAGTPPPNTPDVGTTQIQFTRLPEGWRD